MTTWWCELALVDGEVRHGVTISADDGRFTSITPDTAPTTHAERLAGFTIPGLANAHSHAFHRALRSRTQEGTGSFWTWRNVMYDAASRLDPDRYRRLATAVFGEMALAGMAVVGEFHYLHHQPDGTPYADPNAMGEALLAAAADAGIRITLLDTLYQHGGLGPDGHLPPAGAQLRYCDPDPATWAERVAALPESPRHRVGAAIHSVRAVAPEGMAIAADWARSRAVPLHAHVSEQVAENDACLAWHGLSPVELLAERGVLGSNFCAVHATHLTEHDIHLLAASGSTVCMCPTTERDLGDGIGPTTALRRAGIPFHLGSDSHATIDHFEEARAIELDERLRSQQRGLHDAASLLGAATEVGHAALGWDDAGRIEDGRRADLTTIRLDSVRTAGTPPHLAVAGAVFAASAADITNVVIDGVTIARDGVHHRIDVAETLATTIQELFS